MGTTRKTETVRHLRFAAIALSIIMMAPLPSVAEGLINPFSSASTGISEADSELMRGALKSVLDAKKAGATADWTSTSSGRAGRATSLDVFQKDGMDCANVEHSFTAGDGTTYKLPFCQMTDGTWKIAF
jgi:surface antigen